MNSKDWHNTHKACPKCKSLKLSQTLVGVIEVDGNYHDSQNTALCTECGWNGKVEDLIPEEQALDTTEPESEPTELRVNIKSIDHSSDVYVDVNDFKRAVINLNDKVVAKLDDDGTINYTNTILGEVKNMLDNVTKIHWLNKHNDVKTDKPSE